MPESEGQKRIHFKKEVLARSTSEKEKQDKINHQKEDWSGSKLIHWIIAYCRDRGIYYDDLPLRQLGTIQDVRQLGIDDFLQIDGKLGTEMYAAFQQSIKCDSLKLPFAMIKKSPGRPKSANPVRKRNEKRNPKVWEYIIDMLWNKAYNPDYVCWENYSIGEFRFTSSSAVANEWGRRRGNKAMNYEKFSRAMRYYYKSNVLRPVLGKRLVYAFGSAAKNWQRPNPIQPTFGSLHIEQ